MKKLVAFLLFLGILWFSCRVFAYANGVTPESLGIATPVTSVQEASPQLAPITVPWWLAIVPVFLGIAFAIFFNSWLKKAKSDARKSKDWNTKAASNIRKARRAEGNGAEREVLVDTITARTQELRSMGAKIVPAGKRQLEEASTSDLRALSVELGTRISQAKDGQAKN